MRILTIGAVTADVLMRVDRLAGVDEEVQVLDVTTYEGGSAANVAVGLRRLGLASAFLGYVGADDDGRGHRANLDSEGVDTTRLRTSSADRPSTRVLVFVDRSGARQLYFHGGAFEELVPATIATSDLHDIDCIHFCTLGPEFVERAIELRRQMGRHVLVSWDPGCVGIEGGRAARGRALLPDVDVLFVNSVEFHRLFDGMTPEHVQRLAATGLSTRVAIKLGEQGAYLFSRSEGLTYHPAFAVATVDSTGAGDAFAAAYLAGLSRKYPAAKLGPFANAVAAMETRAYGCRAGLPTLEEAIAFVRTTDASGPGVF